MTIGNEEQVDEFFPNDTKNHVLSELVENGVHRSMKFSPQDSFCYGFRIITYPGGLLYTGDMRTFVFERAEDMFRFFRGDTVRSLSYCAEKCVAGNIREYSEEKARQYIDEMHEDYGEEDWTAEKESQRQDLIRQWGYCDNRQHDFYRLLYETEISDISDMPNTETLTYDFLWCLRAIELVIQRYDEQAIITDTPEGGG